MTTTASNYRTSKQRCERRAEHSADDNARVAWLELAESYEQLLRLEKSNFPKVPKQIGGKRFE